MNKYIKKFLHRGLIFAGFGPVVVGIVYAILDVTLQDFSLDGGQVLVAIVSTYVLAFLQAGVSVFNQIEDWPIAKSLFFHFATLYLAYVGCYILNSWIPFEPMVLVVFTLVFVLSYLAIWISVYLSVRAVGKRFNEKIMNKTS